MYPRLGRMCIECILGVLNLKISLVSMCIECILDGLNLICVLNVS